MRTRKYWTGLTGWFLIAALGWVAIAGSAAAGINEWTEAGPLGTNIHAVIVDPENPSTVYVSGLGGVFKSTDGAESWASSSRGIGRRFVFSMVMDPSDPSILYARTQRGVFKSTDSAASWQPANSGFMDPTNLRSLLAVHPSNPDVLYIGAEDGIYRTSDGAASWTRIHDSLGLMSALAIDPVTPTTLYAGTDIDLWKSEDGGSAWTRVLDLLDVARLCTVVIDPVTPSTLYVGSGDGIFKSVDAGGTWNRMAEGLSGVSACVIVIDPVTPSTVYAGTFFSGRVFKSIDGGATWLPIEPFEYRNGVTAIALDPSDPEVIYVGRGNNRGISKTVDGGTTWEVANRGLVGTQIDALAIDPADPAVMYAVHGLHGVRKTVDGGISWAPARDGLANTSGGYNSGVLAIDPQQPQTLYVGNLARGVFKTVDGGQQWTRLIRSPSVLQLAIAPSDPATLTTATHHGVGRSTDGGETWQVLASPFRDPTALAVDPGSASTVYLASEIGLSKSVDGGVSWTSIHQGLPPLRQVRSIAIDPMDGNVLYAGTTDSGVYKSLDGGTSWSAHNEGLPLLDIAVIRIDPRRPSTVVAAAAGVGGVYISRDGGGHWVAVEQQLDAAGVLDLEIDPSNSRRLVAATTNAGVAEITQAGTCVTDDTTLCLDDRSGDRRFEIALQLDSELGGGLSDPAQAIPLDTFGVDDGGLLWFFDPFNPEVLVKVLDGCAINNHYWVFYAAATTLGFDLEVRDTLFGTSKVYTSPDQQPAPTIADTQAFATCEGDGVAFDPSPFGPTSETVSRRFGSSPAPSIFPPEGCIPGPTGLCIDFVPGDSRFEVTLDYATALGGGSQGSANAIPLTPLGVDSGGLLWFFDRFNPEVLVKVLDGCAINGRVWVYFAAATTVGFDLTVRDTVTGEERTYTNPDQQRAATVADTNAFAICDG